MIGGIPVGWLVQGGAAGVVTIGVFLIMLGRLVPLRTLRDAQKVADKWEAAYEAERSRNAELVHQALVGLEVGKTAVAMIDGMKQAAAGRPDVTS